MVDNQMDHANVKIAPPVILLAHVLAVLLLRWLLPLSFRPSQTLGWLGYALMMFGIGLAASAVSGFRRAHTMPNPHEPVRALVTAGAYRFSRNPIYLGFICLLAGFSLALRTYWGLILSPVFIVLMNILVIQHEEAYLEEKFSDVYTNYKSRVRRWL